MKKIGYLAIVILVIVIAIMANDWLKAESDMLNVKMLADSGIDNSIPNGVDYAGNILLENTGNRPIEFERIVAGFYLEGEHGIFLPLKMSDQEDLKLDPGELMFLLFGSKEYMELKRVSKASGSKIIFFLIIMKESKPIDGKAYITDVSFMDKTLEKNSKSMLFETEKVDADYLLTIPFYYSQYVVYPSDSPMLDIRCEVTYERFSIMSEGPEYLMNITIMNMAKDPVSFDKVSISYIDLKPGPAAVYHIGQVTLEFSQAWNFKVKTYDLWNYQENAKRSGKQFVTMRLSLENNDESASGNYYAGLPPLSVMEANNGQSQTIILKNAN